jgi:hypothetical protein
MKYSKTETYKGSQKAATDTQNDSYCLILLCMPLAFQLVRGEAINRFALLVPNTLRLSMQ